MRKIIFQAVMTLLMLPDGVQAASSKNITAQKFSPNTLTMPVAVSFPSSPEAIEKSLISFGNERFQAGFDVSQTLDDVAITDPFSIKLSGVAYKGHIDGRLDRDAKGLMVEAQIKKLELTIDRISIHSVVNARVAGVDASIRIDAECANSKISWTDQTIAFFARGRLSTNPSLALDMSGLSLPADMKKPEMTLSCQGPFGMESLIRDYAWTAIQSRWTDIAFANEVETQIESSFAKMLAVGGPGLNLINQPELKLTLVPEQYVVQSGATHLRAHVDVQLDRPMTMATVASNAVVLPTGKINQVTLSISTSSIQSIFQEWFSPAAWSMWIDAQTIDSFRELMDSRLKQFIAFPELQNYSKDAPFWFALNMTSRPLLACNNGSLDASAPVGAWMLLKDPAQPIGYKPMVYFNLPARLSVSLPQVKTKKPTSAKLEELGLSYQFDQRYIDEERPNAIIADEQIRGGIEDFAKNKISNLTAIEGAVGETAKALNQTDVSCDSATQIIQVRLPASP